MFCFVLLFGFAMDGAVYDARINGWTDGTDLKNQLLVLPPNFSPKCSTSPGDGSYSFVLPESDQTSLIVNGVKNGIYLLVDGNGMANEVADDPAVGKTRIGDVGKVRPTERREMIVVKDPRYLKVQETANGLTKLPHALIETPEPSPEIPSAPVVSLVFFPIRRSSAVGVS